MQNEPYVSYEKFKSKVSCRLNSGSMVNIQMDVLIATSKKGDNRLGRKILHCSKLPMLTPCLLELVAICPFRPNISSKFQVRQ
jgi:hypothetical protein